MGCKPYIKNGFGPYLMGRRREIAYFRPKLNSAIWRIAPQRTHLKILTSSIMDSQFLTSNKRSTVYYRGVW